MQSSQDFVALLGDLAGASQPKVTWYSPTERTELSGAVLGRWMAKAANYLTGDLAVTPNMVVHLDLPAHWRQLCWALGALTAGASISFGLEGEADVVVTTRPLAWTDTLGEVVALDLAPLALQYDGELAPMQHDGNAELLSAADQLLPMPYGDAGDIALADTHTPYRDLASMLGTADGQRIAVRADEPWPFAKQAIAQLLAGGSIVALSGEVDHAAICAQEGACERP